jgi:hypothetical protein
MIIIKTKTGDIFVNDREMVNVTNNRELHTAEIHDGKVAAALWHEPPIEHVESVVYINEQTAKEWKDNGSELEYLHKEMDSLKLELRCQTEITKNTKERLLQLGHDCVQWVQYNHEEMPKYLCKLMRDRGEEAKAYVNNDEDWAYRREWMQNHQKPEEIEADEVARLNTIVEAQAAEIRELKDQIECMEANERMRTATQSPKEEPEEKKPWWYRLMAWFD